MKRFIVPAIAALSMLAATGASAANSWVKHDVSALNVRTGPSTYYQVVGSVHACQPLDVIKWENNWAQIGWNGYQYWVAASYLQNYPCPAYTPPKPVNTYTPPKPPAPYTPPATTYGGNNY